MGILKKFGLKSKQRIDIYLQSSQNNGYTRVSALTTGRDGLEPDLVVFQHHRKLNKSFTLNDLKNHVRGHVDDMLKNHLVIIDDLEPVEPFTMDKKRVDQDQLAITTSHVLAVYQDLKLSGKI